MSLDNVLLMLLSLLLSGSLLLHTVLVMGRIPALVLILFLTLLQLLRRIPALFLILFQMLFLLILLQLLLTLLQTCWH